MMFTPGRASSARSPPRAPFWSVLWDAGSRLGRLTSRRRNCDDDSAGTRSLYGQNPWSWRQMVAVCSFLLVAVPRLHVHRFGPFFGLLAAGWAGSHRNGAIAMMVQLGHGLYTVQIRGHGDKWWPISHGADLPAGPLASPPLPQAQPPASTLRLSLLPPPSGSASCAPPSAGLTEWRQRRGPSGRAH